MQSVMTSQHSFAKAPSQRIPRAMFNRSHGVKTTFDAGKLVPMFLEEVLPGDTFNVRTSGFARLATPIHPIMDNMFMDTFYFFVPNRLVWDNWQKFTGERIDPGDPIDFQVPRNINATINEGSLGDYLGLPLGDINAGINVLPIRAIGLIWNEWFRDQNHQDSLTIAKDDTNSTGVFFNGQSWLAANSLPPRGKRHDYFTTCLTSPQKGDAVSMPLGTSAPIHLPDTIDNSGDYFSVYSDFEADYKYIRSDLSNATMSVGDGTEATAMYANLADATAATINDLRLSFATQQFLERDARGGTRYAEILRSHFGVVSPDGRLQRPEYLGGGSTPINITPVAQTSSTDATTPKGDLAAFGTSAFNGHGFSKSFVEHGYVIGFVNVRADLTYQQGMNRMWSRLNRFDFYWPEFANLGEQPVYNKEIFTDGTSADDDVFGYNERWAEYRYKPSLVTGAFRSNAAAPLDAWHLAQDFSTRPALNDTFIVDNPPIDRVVAVPSEPHFKCDLYHDFKAVRPLPLYSVPGLDRL